MRVRRRPQCGTDEGRPGHRARVDSPPGRRPSPAAAHQRADHVTARRAERRPGRQPVRPADRARDLCGCTATGTASWIARCRAATTRSQSAYVERLAAAITAQHARAAMLPRLKPADYEAWAREGFATTKASVYPATLEAGRIAGRRLPPAGLRTAQQAIAIAGLPAWGSAEQDVRPSESVQAPGSGLQASGPDRRCRPARLRSPPSRQP